MNLVTGGAGFIGSHIVKNLAERGHRVRVLDNLSSGKMENLAGCLERIEFVQADIRDGSLKNALKDVEIIYHQAAIASVERSVRDPVETESVNVGGTLNLLQQAEESGVKRFVLAGSAAVYGDQDTLPLKEDIPVNPLSPYAISKYACEIYARYFSGAANLETVVLRYFNVYGPNQDPASDYSGVVSRFMERMANGKRPVIFGDGRQTRDFIYVGDIVRANLLAAHSPRVGRGETFNIAGGRSISINELAGAINDVLGTALKPLYRAARKGDVRCSQADISTAYALLGFEPQINYSQGLSLLIAWWQKNRSLK